MAFRPLHDRVLVRRIEAEEKTAGGIIIPDNAKEKPSEGEIVAVGSGAKAEDICRKLGISNGTFYNWRSKYAGLEVNEAKRLRELEAENHKLKKLLAEKLLENEAMKDVLSKKW